MEIKNKMRVEVAEKEEKLALLRNANKPNPKGEDKKALRKYFDNEPDIWSEIGDLVGTLQDTILRGFSDSYLMQESYRRKIKEMRDNLGWNESSEIEKILIEQICVNWLRLNLLEAVSFEKMQKNNTIATGLYWDKALTGAQRRYIKACESLAKVRKLLAEAELREAQACAKRSQSTRLAQQILKDATS
jgi:hypothetical protein